MKENELNIDVDMRGYEFEDTRERIQAGKYMVEVAGAVLHDRKPDEPPPGLNIEDVYVAAKRHGLDCIVYDGIRKTKAADNRELMEKWTQRSRTYAMQGIIQQSENRKICETLSKEGVRVLPMKGSIMKKMYPKQEYRHMTDADILIDRKNMEKTRRIMEELGYQFAGSESGDTVERYIKDPWMTVEMHTYMLPFRYKNHARYLDVWKRCTEENGIGQMNWDDFYIFMIEHFAKHFDQSGCGVRFVLDIYVFLKEKGKEQNRAYIMQELRQMGLEQFCITMEKIACDWFDEKPQIGDSKYETIILLAGAFGITEWVYASRQKEFLDKYKIPCLAKAAYIFDRSFMDYHDMKVQYPILRKLPFLLPCTWVLRFFRIMLKSRTAMKKELQALGKNLKI